MFGFIKRRRRARLWASPLPPDILQVLDRNVPYAQWLPAAERNQWLRHTQVLLAEKHYEGCGGLELTDEMRATVAGQAAILLINRDSDYFPRLFSILLYPTDFVVPRDDMDDEYDLVECDRVLIGESSSMGAVALAWSQIRYDIRHPDDGTNVILHEFVHQIDAEDLSTEGMPLLESRGEYAEWVRVLTAEYERLNAAIDRNRRGVIDEYGASDPAEFFAVVTESFFERPHALQRNHPELYGVLKDYYRQDPAAWVPPKGPFLDQENL